MFQGMEYVYEVYREKSFSKAAKNLYISQPSLSATIKKIETRIGSPIFDRSTTPIQLTECGKEYIKCVEKILDVQNGFSSFLSDLSQLKKGQLSIGCSNYFASFILPPIVTAFTEKFPQVKVNLVEGNSTLLEKKLLAGSLDLAIDNSDFSPRIYQKYTLCEENLLLAVPRKFSSNHLSVECQFTAEEIIQGRHLSGQVKAVCLKNFQEDPFIFLRFGNDTRRRADKICLNHGISPRIVLKLEQQATAYHLAAYGLGITFVSDKLVQRALPSHQLIYYSLEDEAARRSICFYHKQSRYVTYAMGEFLKTAMAHQECF